MKKENLVSMINAYDQSAAQYQNTIAKLKNYDHTYEYLIELLSDSMMILDLACGPANISKYLLKKKNLRITGYDLSDEMLSLARQQIPNGVFENKGIDDFDVDMKVDLVVNGFGLPYLDDEHMLRSLKKSFVALKTNGLIYLSFMDGSKSGFETPSFNQNVEFFLYYHSWDVISDMIKKIGFTVIKKWEIDYNESDGRVTRDIVVIAQKLCCD